MTARKTGDPLFDILWENYPPRINGAGVWEKKKKGAAIKWFKKHKPSEEEVFDMVEVVKADKENRAKSEASGKFYSPPPDLIVFLNGEGWLDEIGVVATKSQYLEANRSVSIRKTAIKSAIAQFQDIVGHRTKAELRENPGFMSAHKTYPEFREWAGKQVYKPDHIVEVNKKVPDVTEGLPPPSKKEKLCGLYRDVVQAKADGRVEEIVKKMNLF